MNDYHPQDMGEVVAAPLVVKSDLSPRKVRNTIFLLSGTVALMMTGFGIIVPVFARRLGEIGGGVQSLSWIIMSFALAQLVAAPFLGSLADRKGRRPFILLGLGAFALANVGFLFAQSTTAFIFVRVIEGALTAGLFPAAMGFVADVVPEDQRARWVGIVMGSYAAGFFLGPIIGGVLYDSRGYAAPFIVSAAMGALALVIAAIFVPETRTESDRKREMLVSRRSQDRAPDGAGSFWASLPRPHHIFGVLLFIDFVFVFVFAFIEPPMVFYLYDELGWTTVQFGVLVATYGLTAVIGQGFLGQLSDRYGRKPLIIIGTLLNTTFYIGIALSTSFYLMLFVAILSGLGEALVFPALSAFYLDITQEQHRSRVMGLKESAAAMGGVAGPLLVILAITTASPQVIFFIAFVLVLVTLGVELLVLKEPGRDREWIKVEAQEYGLERSMVAQATMRGIVATARVERE